jgi:hypothetical protein
VRTPPCADPSWLAGSRALERLTLPTWQGGKWKREASRRGSVAEENEVARKFSRPLELFAGVLSAAGRRQGRPAPKRKSLHEPARRAAIEPAWEFMPGSRDARSTNRQLAEVEGWWKENQAALRRRAGQSSRWQPGPAAPPVDVPAAPATSTPTQLGVPDRRALHCAVLTPGVTIGPRSSQPKTLRGSAQHPRSVNSSVTTASRSMP